MLQILLKYGTWPILAIIRLFTSGISVFTLVSVLTLAAIAMFSHKTNSVLLIMFCAFFSTGNYTTWQNTLSCTTSTSMPTMLANQSVKLINLQSISSFLPTHTCACVCVLLWKLWEHPVITTSTIQTGSQWHTCSKKKKTSSCVCPYRKVTGKLHLSHLTQVHSSGSDSSSRWNINDGFLFTCSF